MNMKVSIVIPAYNEAQNITQVVRELCDGFKHVENSFEIIVVDNGSTDETPKILKELEKDVPQLSVVRVFPNKGYGNGIILGLERAHGEVLGWMHADNQAKPCDAVNVYRKVLDEKLDLCKIVRITREHPMRLAQSRAYNVLFRLMFNTPCGDINGSPKFFRRSLYKKTNLSSRDWFIDSEIIIKAERLGASIGEVPVVWQKRVGGFSKVNMRTGFEFLRNMFLYRFFNKK